MRKQERSLTIGSSLLALAFLISCGAPENPPPPKWTLQNPGASAGTPRAASQAPSAKPSIQTNDPSTTSSLEALQRGASTATPASSPLKDIGFSFDRYDLTPTARDILKSNAEWLKSNPAVKVQIEGHCDDRGTVEYNLALGAKRAEAARDHLVTLGIAADRLTTISYGEEIPVCKEQSESCWEKNRRDRFVIVPGRPTS